jgi:hypothetical protein
MGIRDDRIAERLLSIVKSSQEVFTPERLLEEARRFLR